MRQWNKHEKINNTQELKCQPITFENSEDTIFSYHDMIVVLAMVLGLVWEKSLGVDSFSNFVLQTNHVSSARAHMCCDLGCI